jgi:hypothetical protein
MRPARPPSIPTEGLAIQNNRFWSRTLPNWRRDGDGPRSLEYLLKQVEKGTQVRSSGLDRVLTELKVHRDAAPEGDLRSALVWLCNAQTRMVNNPSTAHSREVLLAAYEVNRILVTAGETPR